MFLLLSSTINTTYKFNIYTQFCVDLLKKKKQQQQAKKNEKWRKINTQSTMVVNVRMFRFLSLSHHQHFHFNFFFSARMWYVWVTHKRHRRRREEGGEKKWKYLGINWLLNRRFCSPLLIFNVIFICENIKYLSRTAWHCSSQCCLVLVVSFFLGLKRICLSLQYSVSLRFQKTDKERRTQYRDSVVL